MKRVLVAIVASLALVAALSAFDGLPATAPDPAKVDAVFAKWTATTPGCAVGVAEDGKAVLEKAYGMADLEHDAPNAADTIFEAGSVSKQFTAAAVLLLAREGKLSLDDQARKHIPELPDYGRPLTIRHMLTHTSGLRDWGEVEGIAGWPRTSRVYTHAHVLDIVSRQKSLNFEPGTNWSYCNTGYNLAAIIVSRVSGMPFAEFCRLRIFEPLGMTRTSWRDDFRRIVKGRAIAYSEAKDGYRQNMPFENVHGNGGLLTTVGDLLKWNENAVTQKVGDAEFLRQQVQPGKFNDGKPHDYALGLYIRSFMSIPEVGHSGSTAGYRAYLARFPKQHLSVAVLCNVSTGNAERAAHQVAALYLRDAILAQTGGFVDLGQDDIHAPPMSSYVGLYRNTLTGVPLSFVPGKAAATLEIEGAAPPENTVSLSGERNGEAVFRPLDSGRTFYFRGGKSLRVANANGTIESYERIEPAKPTGGELGELAGTYSSDEAETVLRVVLSGDTLTVTRRPDATLALRPIYKDAFSAQGLGLVRFRRDAAGRVIALSVTLDRVWDLRFERIK
jgi:CubicO group peptidase (beta-lactamase class C family)